MRSVRRVLVASALLSAPLPAVTALAAEPDLTAQAGDAASLLETGKDQYRAGQFAEAVVTFEAVLAADPGQLNAHRGLGRSLEKLERFVEAEKAYRAMRAAFPDEPESLYRLGIVLRKLGRYEESVTAYREFAAERPDDPDPWYGMGESLREIGDQAGALEAYRRYVELEKRPAEQRYVERAREHIAALEAATATAAAPDLPDEPVAPSDETTPRLPDKVVHTPDAAPPDRPQVATGDVEAATNAAEAIAAGDLSFNAGNYVHAAGRYRAAQLAAPGTLEPAYKLGVALAAAGDLGGAIDAWEAALDAQPDFEPTRRNIAAAQRRLAVEAVLDDPALAGDAAARRALATRYLDEGRFRLALRAAEALVEVAPDSAEAWRLVARAQLGLANGRGALDAVQRELALEPSDVHLYRAAAEAHELLAQPSEAVYFYELYLSNAAATQQSVPVDEIRARIEALAGAPATHGPASDAGAPDDRVPVS